ncbi:MAG: SMC-Scp complex subunit ScpB [Gemmataceae bacterium]
MNHARMRYGSATRRPFTERPGNAARLHGLRFRTEPAADASTDPLGREPDLARLEAVLMMADEPLPARRLADAVGVDTPRVRELIAKLKSLLDADGTAFQVEEIAGGFQLLSRPVFHPWLTRLKRTGHELRLTPAAMETLAVIAYKQPVMRAEVEVVRGVACNELIRHLMEKGLVRIAGRHDSLGRPQLYGTTKKFLQSFGLNSLKDLPEVEALRSGKS